MTSEESPGSVTVIDDPGDMHGYHWDSVCEDNDVVTSFLQASILNEPAIAATTDEYADMGVVELAGHSGRINDVTSTMAVVTVLPTTDRDTIVTAYPVILSNNRVSLDLVQIRRWPTRIEAILSGNVGEHGVNLKFFPVDFFFRRNEYTSGSIKEVSLGGFAYNFGVNPFKGQTTTNKDGKVISLDDTELLFPLDQSHGTPADDYMILGHLKGSHKVPSILGDAYILTLSCEPIGDIDIFFRSELITELPPAGTMIGANTWLQCRDPTWS